MNFRLATPPTSDLEKGRILVLGGPVFAPIFEDPLRIRYFVGMENYNPNHEPSVDSPESRERKFRRDLFGLMLKHAEHLWQMSPEPKPDFKDILRDHISMEIITKDPEKAKALIQRIEGERNSDAGWIENVLALADEHLKNLRQRAPLPKTWSAGLISWSAKHEPALEKYGISPNDKVLDIHVEEAFKHDGVSLRPRDIEKNFQKIAQTIAKDYPDVKAVIGQSWLMNQRHAGRYGFQIPEDIPGRDNGMSAWLQFVDMNGNIKEDLAKRLLETGEIPYKSHLGFMPIKDFLERYLPQDGHPSHASAE